MYRKAMPKCEVKGALDPVLFSHMGIEELIPAKCAKCEYFLEGECLRAEEQIGGYLPLDYGACRVNGSCIPVQIESSRFYIPEKCVGCSFLAGETQSGYQCLQDKEIWKKGKPLDWGEWTPDLPNIGYAGLNIDESVLEAVKNGAEVFVIKRLRLLNNNLTLKFCRQAYADLRCMMEKFG
ncbi:hypothetical protein [Hahella chejuensis]|nr:hypothetical protein [Hahella chejuensis]